jgi:hypothetical protein
MLRITLAISLTALLAASAAQAQTVTPRQPGVGTSTGGTASVAERKQHIMARIQERMGILQNLQSCVAAAQDTTALRTCEEQARAANGAHEKKC